MCNTHTPSGMCNWFVTLIRVFRLRTRLRGFLGGSVVRRRPRPVGGVIAGSGDGGRRRLGPVAWTAVLALAALGAVASSAAPAARADDVTASQNTLRDGWDASEQGLSPAVLQGGSFGQLFSTAVQGQVYAQPVVAGSTVVVATQQDYVYGLDAASGAIRWSLSLGTKGPTAT